MKSRFQRCSNRQSKALLNFTLHHQYRLFQNKTLFDVKYIIVFPTVSELVSFLENFSQQLEDAYMDSQIKSKPAVQSSTQHFQPFQRQRNSFMTTSDTDLKVRVSVCCGDENHKIYPCHTFKNLSVSQRNTLIQEKKSVVITSHGMRKCTSRAMSEGADGSWY